MMEKVLHLVKLLLNRTAAMARVYLPMCRPALFLKGWLELPLCSGCCGTRSKGAEDQLMEER